MHKYLITILISLVLLPSANARTDDQPMNVLVLIADDLNTWLLGDGNRYVGKVVAPNLRGLADSGVNFERAYTASPVCSPSRTALFSGMAPWRTGVYHNGLTINESEPLKSALSLPGLFKRAGYSTFGYGKITHGWSQREYWDDNVGHKRDPRPPGGLFTPVGRGEQDWGPIHLPEEEMNGTQMADYAISQLEKDHDKPFFLGCGLFNPHMPWYVPQKYFDLFPLDEITIPPIMENDLEDVPPHGQRLADRQDFVEKVIQAGLHKEAIRGYLAATAYADAQLGRVLDALDNSPYKDNTIVVFFSDHGFHLGEKQHWQKATLWEEATHCLLMFRVPGLTPAGKVSERFVSLQDIYPTLADLCGLNPPDYVDGRSLMPLLKDPYAPWQSTAITSLTEKNNPVYPYFTIRNEVGRYTLYKDGEEEFYDTAKDPHEWTNLINNPEYAPVIQKLRAAIPDPAKAATPLQRSRK